MKFIVEIILPEVLDQELIDILPSQYTEIGDLMSEGIISSFMLSDNAQKAWLTLDANSVVEVDNILNAFKLYDYVKMEISELSISEVNPPQVPTFSLN
ncbi:hypothetical protein EI427_07155 [Flammeovirga pectinis]|uniref:Muconolactone isomerase domain-containing protein n=1 Tax=Flammeovirga pectinis TaxID=2494373 RepID=A0A3S9P1F8_9BACT|nr:hypothetical protein [Flammeovirga pectinis]AZQ62023.1 hypothetical protein EI427_07155 [Flammeovirga pectinis]